MATRLEQLASDLQSVGVQATFKPGSLGCVDIFHELNDEQYCIYEVIPWRADPTVPVLYFALYTTSQGGTRPATASEFTQWLAQGESGESKGLRDSSWISPTEHPVSGLPTLMLHPCRTQEWLADNGDNLWLWLQYFGSLVGLDIHVAPQPLQPR